MEASCAKYIIGMNLHISFVVEKQDEFIEKSISRTESNDEDDGRAICRTHDVTRGSSARRPI